MQQLPDHHEFQHRTDPARNYDEGVRRQDEMVQAREEGLVFKRLLDERVDFLFKGKLDADPDGAVALGGVRGVTDPAQSAVPPATTVSPTACITEAFKLLDPALSNRMCMSGLSVTGPKRPDRRA